MLTLPIIYFLYAFGIVMAVWLLYAAVSLLHLITSTNKNGIAAALGFIFTAVSVVLVLASSAYINTFDWQANITLGFSSSSELLDLQ